MTSTDELESQIHAQDCELEYWFQQAENYAEVQIPADDLRAIIARTYAAVNALPELLERVRRLEAALRPFADRPWVELLSDDLSPNHLISMDARVGDLRRAAQTLKERHDG